ncbi:hypothetical protein [Dehalobacter sp. 4CP]
MSIATHAVPTFFEVNFKRLSDRFFYFEQRIAKKKAIKPSLLPPISLF